VAALAEARISPPVMSEVVEWSSFRASRDGVGATIRYSGEERRLAEVVREVVARVSPWARDLDCLDALSGVERIVREGGGAGRQRSVLRGGGLPALVRHLVEWTGPPGPG
jgi:gamma-glutamyl:cysteine ligase YbdK (ATP-grasp superfamily)